MFCSHAPVFKHGTIASSEFIWNVVVDKNVIAEISARSSASSLWSSFVHLNSHNISSGLALALYLVSEDGSR